TVHLLALPTRRSSDLYGNGWFVATSRAGILASRDGLNWTLSDQEPGFYDLRDVTFGGGKFVAVGKSGVVLQSVLFQPPRFESIRSEEHTSALQSRVDL